ncbi:MAG: DUF4179 domain-containing protein [Clostridium sp.]
MIKNKYNDIKLPENLDNLINSTIDVEWEKHRKWKKRRRFINSIAACIACFSIITIFSPDIVDAAISPITLIIEKLNKKLKNRDTWSDFTTEYNTPVRSNGVSVSISKTEFDGRCLYVTYYIKSNTPFYSSESQVAQNQLLYTGEGNVSFTNEVLNNSGVAGLEGNFIDKYTFEGVEKYDFTTIGREIPDTFDFEILINLFRCIPNEGDDIADLMTLGDWGFKVKVNKEDSIRTYTINDSNNKSFGIKDISISNHEIYVTSTHASSVEPFSYNINIKDENGNLITYETAKWDTDNSISTFTQLSTLTGSLYTIELYDYTPNSNGDILYSTTIDISK